MLRKFIFLFMVSLLIQGCSQLFSDKNSNQQIQRKFNYDSKIGFYKSCDELDHDIQQAKSEYATYLNYWADDASIPPTSGSSVANFEGAGGAGFDPLIQEQEVQESDILKQSETWAFYVRNQELIILDSKKKELFATINLPKNENIKLILAENDIVVIGYNSETKNTELRKYNFNIEKVDTKERLFKFWPGSYSEIRGYQNHILITFNSDLLQSNGVSNLGVECSKITKKQVNDFDYNFTRMIAVHLSNNTETGLGVIGGSDYLYSTKNNIYLVKTKWDYSLFGDSFVSNEPISVVRKVSIDPEQTEEDFFKNQASGSIEGYIRDRWAIKEIEQNNTSYLALAHTTGRLFSGTSEDFSKNHLTVFKENLTSGTLDKVSSIDNFGNHEEIRAIRYVNNLVYIVTFRKTDPLFVINIQDIENPNLQSELKAPGFSTILIPLKNQNLLGIGFDVQDYLDFSLAQGIQVSLFDVQDPLKSKTLDQVTFGGRWSYSEATKKPLALYLNQETSTMAMPIVEFDKEFDYRYNLKPAFTGALILGIDSDSKIRTKAKISHKSWIPEKCISLMSQTWWDNTGTTYDIQRIIRIGEFIAALSPVAITFHEESDPKKTAKEILFVDSENQCNNRPRYGEI
jgi:uncharacterized secreted protein with C-terminal beta-propeller domain